MRDWFETLQPREQLLLSFAVILSTICILWLGAASPILQAKAAAKSREVSSARALDIVASGLAGLSLGQSVSNPASNSSLSADERRRLITLAAQETGLLLTQLRSETDGSVSVVLRDVDPRLVFAFVQLLSTRDQIEPSSASLARSQGNTVSASLVFEEPLQ